MSTITHKGIRPVLSNFLLATTVLLSGLSVDSLAQEAAQIEKLTQQWLAIESQKGSLQAHWIEKEQRLKLQYQLLNAEKKALTDYLKKVEGHQDQVAQERIDLAKQQNTIEQEQQQLSALLGKSIAKIQTLMPLLPPPLFDEWQKGSAYLSNPSRTNSEKLEKVLALAQSIKKFDDRIAIHQTVMNLPTGEAGESRAVQVKQLYLNHQNGWFVSSDGKTYGYGRPTQSQWQWWVNNQAQEILSDPLSAKQIQQVINSVESPGTAKISELPLIIGVLPDTGASR